MKKKVSVILIMCLALTLSACGKTTSTAPNSSSVSAETSVSSKSGDSLAQSQDDNSGKEEANKTTYPLTIENYDGEGNRVEQTFEKAPERIVSNQPQAVQLLLALGLDDKIVGACTSVGDVGDTYKERFDSLNIISDTDSPSKEVVIDQEPDIIIGWGSTFNEKALGNISEWNEKGIHTYIMDNTASDENNRTVERIYTDIENLGKIFDVQDKAFEMIDSMKQKQEDIEKKTSGLKDEEKVKVLTVQIVKENEFFGRAKKDLTTDLITKAGGISLDETFGSQSVENLIHANPDVLLIINRTDSSADDKIKALKENPSLENVNAIKNNRFVSVDYVDFYGGNYETMDTVTDMAQEFYPNLFQ